MKFGYNTNGAIGYPFEEAIRQLHDMGYEGVGITLDHSVLNPFDAALSHQVASVSRLLHRLSMACVIETGARYLLNATRKHAPTLVSADAAERAFRVEFLKRAIDIASDLGSDCVSIWSGVVEDTAESTENETLDRLALGVDEVCEYAAKAGVAIGFEPEPGMRIATLDDYSALRSRTSHPSLKLTLDIGHVVCQNECHVEFAIEHYGSEIVNIHLEDVRLGVHEHLPLGQGIVPFPAVLSALRRIHYASGIYVELSRHSHAFPAIARESIHFLRSLK